MPLASTRGSQDNLLSSVTRGYFTDSENEKFIPSIHPSLPIRKVSFTRIPWRQGGSVVISVKAKWSPAIRRVQGDITPGKVETETAYTYLTTPSCSKTQENTGKKHLFINAALSGVGTRLYSGIRFSVTSWYYTSHQLYLNEAGSSSTGGPPLPWKKAPKNIWILIAIIWYVIYLNPLCTTGSRLPRKTINT